MHSLIIITINKIILIIIILNNKEISRQSASSVLLHIRCTIWRCSFKVSCDRVIKTKTSNRQRPWRASVSVHYYDRKLYVAKGWMKQNAIEAKKKLPDHRRKPERTKSFRSVGRRDQQLDGCQPFTVSLPELTLFFTPQRANTSHKIIHMRMDTIYTEGVKPFEIVMR